MVLNTKNKFLIFPYYKKKVTLQGIIMKSDMIVPSSKDLNDISKVTIQENHKSILKMRKEFNEVISDKNKEIFGLKYHSEKLLAQVKKSKAMK